ncbi:MAG: hypothetical protein ACOC3I_02135, partial [Verrucomicrobiota bacterium]
GPAASAWPQYGRNAARQGSRDHVQPPVFTVQQAQAQRGLRLLADGVFGVRGRVLSASNPSLPFTQWTILEEHTFLGEALEVLDPAAAGAVQRFYTVVIP